MERVKSKQYMFRLEVRSTSLTVEVKDCKGGFVTQDLIFRALDL